MSNPRNIEIFEQLVARILNRLYAEFPNPTGLDVRSIGYEVAEALDSNDEESFRILTSDAENAMRFLAKEGFVEFDQRRGSLSDPSTTFPEALLTLKGLALMGATPAAVDASVERRPIAQQLSDALDEGARTTVGDLVKKLFLGALSAGTSVLSG